MGTNTPGSTMLGRNIALAGSVLEKKERLVWGRYARYGVTLEVLFRLTCGLCKEVLLLTMP